MISANSAALSRTLEPSKVYLDRVRDCMSQAEQESLPQRARQAIHAAEQLMKLAERARRMEMRTGHVRSAAVTPDLISSASNEF